MLADAAWRMTHSIMASTLTWKVTSRLAIAASRLPRPVYFRLLTYVLQPLLGLAEGRVQAPGTRKNRAKVGGVEPAQPTTPQSPGAHATLPPPAKTTRSPRALIIDGLVPTPDKDAGSHDIYWFMRILLELGYEVTFVPALTTAHAGRYTDDLEALGIVCPVAPMLTSARDFVMAHGNTFDLVAMYRITVAQGLIDVLREFAPKAKVIFNTVDLHFLREQREAKVNGQLHAFVEAKRREKQELAVIRSVDAAILLSEFEYNYVARHAPEARRFFVPLASPIPGRLGPYDGRAGVLFVGGFTHTPNIDAVNFLCGTIWPLVRGLVPDAKLFVVGANPPDEIAAYHAPAAGIEIMGYVEDLTKLYRSARVAVAPLRFGAGLKGKVVSSLAVGLPCVVTSIAGEGMPLGGMEAIAIVDDPKGFARAIATIHENPDIWYRMSDAGLGYARDNFSVETIAGKVSAILADLGLPVTPSRQGY
jgi:glycosyltransferase involved in cell wall biosynthesis